MQKSISLPKHRISFLFKFNKKKSTEYHPLLIAAIFSNIKPFKGLVSKRNVIMKELNYPAKR